MPGIFDVRARGCFNTKKVAITDVLISPCTLTPEARESLTRKLIPALFRALGYYVEVSDPSFAALRG